MSDIMSAEARSRLMSKIRSKNTKPEVRLRKALWHRGLRYRLHADLAGKPDVAFLGPKVAVFIDGCFWHGCPEHGQLPKQNRKFWREKINSNTTRDEQVRAMLEGAGWKVLRFWEHEIRRDLSAVVSAVESAVATGR